MDSTSVLFICNHNAARSQMAEAWLNRLGEGRFQAESAGFEPTRVNPYVVEVMREAGIDIGQAQSDDVFEFYKDGRRYHYTITVCDQSLAERCPIFPGLVLGGRLHWSFADPESFTGTDDEILEQTRQVRDSIRRQVEAFIASSKPQ